MIGELHERPKVHHTRSIFRFRSDWRAPRDALSRSTTQGPSSGSEVIGELHVTPEVHLSLESPAALGAGEGLEAGVLAAVGDEVGALAERLAADGALVGLLSYNSAEDGPGYPREQHARHKIRDSRTGHKI